MPARKPVRRATRNTHVDNRTLSEIARERDLIRFVVAATNLAWRMEEDSRPAARKFLWANVHSKLVNALHSGDLPKIRKAIFDVSEYAYGVARDDGWKGGGQAIGLMAGELAYGIEGVHISRALRHG